MYWTVSLGFYPFSQNDQVVYGVQTLQPAGGSDTYRIVMLSLDPWTSASLVEFKVLPWSPQGEYDFDHAAGDVLDFKTDVALAVKLQRGSVVLLTLQDPTARSCELRMAPPLTASPSSFRQRWRFSNFDPSPQTSSVCVSWPYRLQGGDENYSNVVGFSAPHDGAVLTAYDNSASCSMWSDFMLFLSPPSIWFGCRGANIYADAPAALAQAFDDHLYRQGCKPGGVKGNCVLVDSDCPASQKSAVSNENLGLGVPGAAMRYTPASQTRYTVNRVLVHRTRNYNARISSTVSIVIEPSTE